MSIPRYDRSGYYSALSRNSQSATNRASARAAATIARNDTTLTRKRIQESNERHENIRNGIKNVATGGVNLVYAGVSGDLSPIIGDKLNTLIQSSQAEQGNAALLPLLTEGAGIAKKALAAGTARFEEVETENGIELVFNPGEELQKWYEESLSAVDGMGFLPSIKSQLRASLTESYWGQVQSLQSSAIDKAYADLEASYGENLEASLVSDAAKWSEYQGKLPEGVFYSGLATIAGRSDFSDDRKASEAMDYLQQVRYLGVQDTAVRVGRTDPDGMAAVDSYLQSLDFLTPQERNNIYSLAQTSYNQMTGAYIDQATALMSEAFISQDSTPEQIIQEIQDVGSANNLPKAVVNEMVEAARIEQRTAIREKVSNQLAVDTAGGYTELTETLSSLENGDFDSWFSGVPEEKATAISDYRQAIEDAETKLAESLDTERKAIAEMDSDILEGYETGLENDWKLFDSGSINGPQYMERVSARTASVREQAQLGTTHESIIAAQAVAMDKVIGYIPQALRSDIESIVEQILVAEGRIAKTASKRTAEEWKELKTAITATNGAIADAIYEYGTGAVTSVEDIYTYADRTFQAFLLSHDILGKDGESDIPLPTDPGVTMKKVITAAVETNTKAVEGGETHYIYLDRSVGYDPTIISDENGTIQGIIPRYLANGEFQAFPEYRFLSVAAQEDFNRRRNVFVSQLALSLGIDEAEIQALPEISQSGDTAIASPVMFADGRVFRVRGYTIQETADGKSWMPFAKINKNGWPDLINPSEADKESQEENISSRINSHIHIEDGRVTVDPEILDDSGLTFGQIYDYIDSQDEYRQHRDFIKDTLYRYGNYRAQGIPKEEW